MQVNAEVFFDNINQNKYKDTAYLIFGNESSFINKIENKIINKINACRHYDKKIFDFKTEKNTNINDLIKSRSLFNEKTIICIKNPPESIIDILEKIDFNSETLIINGENIKNNSKIQKYFQSHKKFYSIVCYKLSQAFKKKLIDRIINENDLILTEDAYWFLVENTSDEYQLFENELEKIRSFNKKNISFEEIKKLSSNIKQIQLDELFIQGIASGSRSIIKECGVSINNSADAYMLLQTAKRYSKILIKTLEKKTERSVSSLVEDFLPKYLFKQKNNFEKIIKNANLEKIITINKLIQKAELLLRQNDVNYFFVIQRFLLNLAKILR